MDVCFVLGDQKTIMYNLMCVKAKIWPNILNKKTTLLDLHKFVLFHLIKNLPIDFRYTIYIAILRNLKGLGGLDDIYYSALISKILRDQGMHHVFNKMDDDSKHTLVAKGSFVAKQQKFRKTNLKAMKVALCRNLPFDRSAGEKPKERLPKRKTRGKRKRRLLMKKTRGFATKFIRGKCYKNQKEVCEF